MEIFADLRRAVNGLRNEDFGHNDHMVGQRKAPFYCGTVFCGHATKKAARACWKRKSLALDEISERAKSLRAAGDNISAAKVELEKNAYYPELQLQRRK